MYEKRKPTAQFVMLSGSLSKGFSCTYISGESYRKAADMVRQTIRIAWSGWTVLHRDLRASWLILFWEHSSPSYLLGRRKCHFQARKVHSKSQLPHDGEKAWVKHHETNCQPGTTVNVKTHKRGHYTASQRQEGSALGSFSVPSN